MSDLISREAVFNILRHLDVNFANSFDWYTLKEVRKLVEEIPSVEDRPKGEWDINCQGIVFCSKCKKVFNHNYDIDYMESHFNFCPNCGADMSGE